MVFTQTSCFRDPEVIYDGPTVVEFNQAIVPNAPISFPVFNVNNGAGEVFTRVNLVGPQQITPQTILYRVDPVRTTAVEGLHYELLNKVGDNGSFAIPANRSFADCGFRVLQAPLVSGASVNITLELLGTTDGIIRPSENYKRLTYRILL
ncbi:MAG: hypothetical protein HC831_30435 [Chloroflexia bacterium]|nr:hypothetical protein [Chloroflexia bacterium]